MESSTAVMLSAGLTVYNFTVDQAHTYYVAPQDSPTAFVLVHNACTNPYGKKGGPAHQAKTREVYTDIENRGLQPVQEVGVTTVNGEKAIRFMDVVAYKDGIIVEIHQVGKTLKTNELKPISRERRALRDIRNSLDVRGAIRYFHSYGTD